MPPFSSKLHVLEWHFSESQVILPSLVAMLEIMKMIQKMESQGGHK